MECRKSTSCYFCEGGNPVLLFPYLGPQYRGVTRHLTGMVAFSIKLEGKFKQRVRIKQWHYFSMDIYLNYKRSLDNIAYPNNNIQLTATPAPPPTPLKKNSFSLLMIWPSLTPGVTQLFETKQLTKIPYTA